jgi:enterochelin esterase-like enzyme
MGTIRMQSHLLRTRAWSLAALLLPALLLPAMHAKAQAPAPAAVDESIPAESNNYPLGQDSQIHPSVAAGKTFTFPLPDSRIFPGTTRTITVYIPAAYHADKPACVYVGLDGLGFNAARVFDNLIAQHAMPVTIAIGVAPGTVPSANPPNNPRFGRSFEFDSRSDLLARFLLEEVLPAVEHRTTAEGQPIRLSTDANDRAIGGGSTGAIAAFTVAWERPDAFRRVFSAKPSPGRYAFSCRMACTTNGPADQRWATGGCQTRP